MKKYAYIHIPFCEKKCKYCSFCSFPLLKYKDKYINALLKDVKFLYKNEKLETIYFGGGTPSLLNTKDFEKILNCFNYDNSTEITLEINPNNITKEKLSDLKKLGISRLSIGVQSFDDEILKEIGRLHNRNDIYKLFNYINKTGFENISIDLMYGLPNQNIDNWLKTIDEALKLNIQHISLYGLKIEQGTYYHTNPPKNIVSLDIQAKMYENTIKKLKDNFTHYEVSNFAKNEKYFSKHNLAYWNCENYFGFGLSASGYLDDIRYTNTLNFKEYIKNPNNRKYEKLSQLNKIEEEIFLGLRLINGIDFNKINKKFNIDIYEKYKKQFDKFLSYKLMKKTQNGIKLTLKGIELQNEILCEFIEG